MDIKLTLSQNDRIYANDPRVEAKFMRQSGPLVYALQGMPRQAESGCWVYFIHRGELVARAKAIDFVKGSQLPHKLYTYQGVPEDKKPPAYVVCQQLELTKKPVPHQGFQGFRYVRTHEQQDFEDAFK